MSADGERSLYDELEKPTVDRRIRQLPRLLRDAVGIVRRAGGTTFKVALALQLLASASVLVQLLVVRSLLTKLIAERQHVQVGDIVGPLVVLVICLGVTAAASVARTAQQELLADLVSRETLYRVLQRAGRVELLEFETSRLHDRLQRAIFNGTFRPLQMTSGLLAVLAGAGGSIGIGIALLAISPIFFVLAIASAVPVWLLGVLSSRVMYRFAYEQTRRDRDRLYLQDLQSERREAKELRAYDLNEHLLGLWRANYDRRIADLRGVVRRRVRSGALASFLSAALLAVAIAALVELVRTGHLSLGAAGAALGGLVVLGAQLQTLGAGIGAVYESALFVQDYTQFVDAPPDPGEYAGFTGTQPAAPFAAVSGRDIGFTYPSGNRAALTGVDIDVAAGEIVALVGENGSGKSTLAKVLAGLYPAGAGTVCWNGADVGTLAIESVRDQVAVLFQDFVRFELTLADNVGFGRWRRAADEAALQHAADMAGAGAVVAGLPDGWASRMGPEYAGGRELSGGQWQRLAIARALFRDAPLVILDEPTAALDPRAEAALFRDVRTLFAGRSVVLVSHRFGSVRTADRIYVLHEGAVVEVGNHDELVAANGRYAEMYRLQRATLLGD